MWIIPKNLPIYHSAQDMQELILDSKKLACLSEQSLMWRSKPLPVKTWLQKWKMDGSIPHLFGRILKPSTGNFLVEEWISSLEDSLVNHLVKLEKEKLQKTQDTCGHISSKESKSLENLQSSSLKMSKESSQQNLNQTNGLTPKEHPFCNMCLESWKGWVTLQRQEYSRRVKSVRPTKEEESLFLELITRSQNQLKPTLDQVCITYKTTQDQTLEISNSTLGSPRGRLWTTPIARDSHEIKMLKQIKPRANGKKRLDTLPRQVHHQENYNGSLNTRWVEILMGLPIGWTSPDSTQILLIQKMN